MFYVVNDSNKQTSNSAKKSLWTFGSDVSRQKHDNSDHSNLSKAVSNHLSPGHGAIGIVV